MTEHDPDQQKWEVLSSRILLESRIMVVQDRLRTPVGKEMDYTWMQAVTDAVAVLAFTDEEQVVVTRQYRHPLGKEILDLPAGGMHAGESSEQAALRELSEETGYTARDIRLLGRFYPGPGLASYSVHVFIARELKAGTPHLDEHEIVDVVLMDWEDLLDKVLDYETVDVTLAYAVLLYAARQRKEK